MLLSAATVQAILLLLLLIIMFISKAHPICRETPEALYIRAEIRAYMINKSIKTKTLIDKSRRIKVNIHE